MSDLVPITVARGDGIGPEIMDATLHILQTAGARLAPEFIEIGLKAYEKGNAAGIAPEAWESLRRTKVFLKSPITTPQGGGFKSLNVTVRKSLGLFANVRPTRALFPFVRTHHPEMDLVIVRENEEDLYSGIEHRQTDEVYQCLKLVSRPGTERIIRYAFEYTRANGRRKLTAMSKDNIMKLTDGLFRSVFEEVGKEYPDIEQEHWIIDIGSALIAHQPERFDVIVTSNLYGDIISDIAAQIAGSVGMGGSSNIGSVCSMFEAIHGSAPDIAGKGIANPSGLLHGALLMLTHIGQGDVAERIHNAWLRTLEDGFHTGDIASPTHTKKTCTTREFADAVCERLGQEPQQLKVVRSAGASTITLPEYTRPAPLERRLIGVDVFAYSVKSADDLAIQLQKGAGDLATLEVITNRGVAVWPDGLPETFCTDHWRCRFRFPGQASGAQVIALLTGLNAAGIEFIKTEHLYEIEGKPAFSKAQGRG